MALAIPSIKKVMFTVFWDCDKITLDAIIMQNII